MSTHEEAPSGARWYWEGYSPNDNHGGADLAIMRQGLGRAVGDIWQMARFYRSATADGGTGPRLAAEHATLALFALHQQSQPNSMHRLGTPFGTAARRLHTQPKSSPGTDEESRGQGEVGASAGKFSQEAVDRRMNQIATATDSDELVAHLRGLVTMLRTIRQPLDYTQLHRDIERWHYPDARTRIRARWGKHYFNWRTASNGSN